MKAYVFACLVPPVLCGQVSAQFEPVSQDRRVFALASAVHMGTVPIGGSQQWEFTAPGYGPFDQLADAMISVTPGSARARAHQRSSISDARFDAEGFLEGTCVTVGGSSLGQARAESEFEVGFNILEATDVRLAGTLRGSAGLPAGAAFFSGTVSLERVDVAALLFSTEVSVARPNAAFDLPLSLVPGQYRIRLDGRAWVDNAGTTPFTSGLDYSLQLEAVPAPATVLVLATAGFRRRRGAAITGSTVPR